ncbi:MAG: dihydrolipoyl dehydrogenase [Prevotella sp.]|nr:dihydrolipoyl dehydrogenase [Prevotellaceae bacterium]MDY5843781.1 dihydrolipoyl dehydrogenase [Prevotella sp.]
MTSTDLIIIGSGPGGYRAADYAAKNGLQVLIFEEQEVGGTCLNSGCIPTKCLAHDASKETIPAFELVMERKQQTIQQLREGVQTLLSQPNITLVRGKAVFKDSHTVVANGEEYQAKHIIIATGSHAKMPPIEGLVYQQGGESNVVTSTELLNIDHVPEKLCIVGAGVIGMEFASAFASFGSKVTVVEFMKECLPTLDSDIAKRLRKCMEKKGIEFYLQAGVKCIHEGKVTFERKGKELTVEADTILIATGRAANMDSLNLDAMGIAYDKKGILVDDNMETSINGIYAIGDTNGRQMLAHAATFQGFRAVNHILGKSDNIRFDIMPAAVFTHPEAASVGKTEDACKAEELNYTVRKGYYRANGRALSMEESEGMAKLIVDEQNKIIGCHIYGAHAAELVQEISALMNMDITLDRLKDIIHTHPTLGEILQDMAIG